LFASLPVLTHAPWQSLSPLGQTHCPLVQMLPVLAQACPHWPQFRLSLPTSAHIPAQHTWLPGHVPAFPHVQLPLTQLSPGWQACPQTPQLVGSVLRFVSQPFPAARSQSPKPERQEKPQVPLLQTGVELAGAEQGLLQAPQ
jgi:hypothetical protein